jgi:hypothetical protein
VSGTLPVIKVGIVWRRGLTPKRTTQDFISLAKAQRTLRNR